VVCAHYEDDQEEEEEEEEEKGIREDVAKMGC
jgi:hypothetical protein